MKIFISACTSFAIALTFAAFSSLYTHRAIVRTEEVLSRLPNIIEENENTPESVLGCIKESERLWSNHSRILSYFIGHRELDEIGALLVTLMSSAESRDSGHYASTLSALKERLEKLSSSESFSLGSIF